MPRDPRERVPLYIIFHVYFLVNQLSEMIVIDPSQIYNQYDSSQRGIARYYNPSIQQFFSSQVAECGGLDMNP